MKYKGIYGRTKLAHFLIDKIRNNNSFSYIIYGPKGCGKKYVIDLVTETLNDEIRTFYFICDSLVEKSKKKNTYSINLSIDLPFFTSISLAMSKDNSTKLNAILNSLKTLNLRKKDVLLRVDCYDDLSSEGKDYIRILIENKKYFEKQLGDINIYILVGTLNEYNFAGEYSEVKLEAYTKNDIEIYLEQKYNKKFRMLSFEKQEQIVNILSGFCGGNLFLIDLIASKIIDNPEDVNDFEGLIEEIANKRLKELQLKGQSDYNIAPGIIEDFLITCSLSMSNVNKNLIEQVGDLSPIEVAQSLKISEYGNKILNRLPNSEYSFVSEQIKSILEHRLSDVTKFAKYYNYYTQFKNDDYLSRAYYLYKAIGVVDLNVYNLLILATSKAMTFNDDSITNTIRKSFYNISEDYLSQLILFVKAFKLFNNAEYADSIGVLKKINLYFLNNIGRAEYDRIYFKNLYLNNNLRNQMTFKFLESLKRMVACDNYLKLNLNELFLIKEEVVLKLKIIFDISPFVIDVLNDVEGFEKLYDTSKLICRIEHNLNSPFAEYIKNTFNRKAFLFVNPMQAESYYEEAEAYFFNNNLWTEYLMTLSGKAGILMAQSRYKDAKETCKKAYDIQHNYKVFLPQEYKLRNNLLIAQFLLYEEENSNNVNAIYEKAKETIGNLLSIYNKNPSVSYVIRLNIASLYLYINETKEYENIKKSIEQDYGCDDISDTDDKSVDDFYSYRFAWMEIYKNILLDKKVKCMEIINKLEGFVPALSHKQDVLWDKKLLCAKEIISSGKKVSSFYFCNNLFKDKRPAAVGLKFFYRGLPLSAIQFTSLS